MKKKYWYGILPVIGVILLIWYVFTATLDVVFTDYIRLVDAYLPDVWNPAKFFVPDVLTRIPLNYAARIINVAFFGYNTRFDMILGVLSLGAAAGIFGMFCWRRQIGLGWFLLISYIMFGLNKWEMLTNGTGWVHFAAFAFFYYHYVVIDRVLTGNGVKKGDHIRMILLPFLITMGVAGPYCAVYSAVMMLILLWYLLIDYRKTRKINKRYLLYFFCVLISLLLYMWSNTYAKGAPMDWEMRPLTEVFGEDPMYFVKFFVKSFGGMMFGGETMSKLFPAGRAMFFWGCLVIAFYLLALGLYFYTRLYKTSILPLILMVAGGANHVLILFTRWRFMDELYGMSSRYALQFQVGILGIVLTFALIWQQKKSLKRLKLPAVMAMLAVCAALAAGNTVTNIEELKKAPYRKIYAAGLYECGHDFRNRSDEELESVFQYKFPQVTRRALEILEENKWNMFRE